MRWNEPKDGQIREVTRFLFLPKTLWNYKIRDYETRWLEFATWKEVYRRENWLKAILKSEWRELDWICK